MAAIVTEAGKTAPVALKFSGTVPMKGYALPSIGFTHDIPQQRYPPDHHAQ
ncbi:hypothetical protein SAMN05216345_101704 [Cupriavidus sp. YR651]|nr:hypothetical protein SAMN05216345_101704 [Cupriavidus sp. YR651]